MKFQIATIIGTLFIVATSLVSAVEISQTPTLHQGTTILTLIIIGSKILQKEETNILLL